MHYFIMQKYFAGQHIQTSATSLAAGGTTGRARLIDRVKQFHSMYLFE